MPKVNDGGVVREMTSDELKVHEETQATIKKEKEEQAKVQYKDDRQMAYPSFADQLDTIYHKGLDAWKAEIKVIKDAHPKPE